MSKDQNFKIILTLPERLKEILKTEAEKKALTVNAYIRLIVAEHLGEVQKDK